MIRASKILTPRKAANPIRPKSGDPMVLMAIAVDPADLGLEEKAPKPRTASEIPRGRSLRRGIRPIKTDPDEVVASIGLPVDLLGWGDDRPKAPLPRPRR